MSETSNGEHTSIADRFLRDARGANRIVSIYLVNGFQLKGEIVHADKDTILFKHKDVHQLIMRAAVASMYPIPDRNGPTDGWWSEYVSSIVTE